MVILSFSSQRVGCDDRRPFISVLPPVVTILRVEFLPLTIDDFLSPFREINDDFVPKKFHVFCRCFENVLQKCSVKTMKNNGFKMPSI